MKVDMIDRQVTMREWIANNLSLKKKFMLKGSISHRTSFQNIPDNKEVNRLSYSRN